MPPRDPEERSEDGSIIQPSYSLVDKLGGVLASRSSLISRSSGLGDSTHHAAHQDAMAGSSHPVQSDYLKTLMAAAGEGATMEGWEGSASSSSSDHGRKPPTQPQNPGETTEPRLSNVYDGRLGKSKLLRSAQGAATSPIPHSQLQPRKSEPLHKEVLEHQGYPVDTAQSHKELVKSWLEHIQDSEGVEPPAPGSPRGQGLPDFLPPLPRPYAPRPADSRIDSIAFSMDNISQYAPSHFADMEMRMAEQAEALKKAPPAQKVAQLKSCLAKPGSGEKKSNMYRLPDELPEHLTIQMPSLESTKWENYVHAAMWRVGRHFGFQAFNPNPKTADLAVQDYVPATIFCASDHLCTLLCKNNYIRKTQGTDSDEMRFAKALHELHANIFQPYEEQWTKLVDLSWRPQEQNNVLESHSYYHPTVLHGLLCELSLYLLIYTESANLRHTPELLWFLYWCMNHSYVMHELWKSGMPRVETDARTRCVELRNHHQHLIHDVQAQLQLHPSRVRPEDCGRISSIISRLSEYPEVEVRDHDLLADLIAFGDGGFFCNRIVTPVFDVMAYEIDHLSNLGVDVAHRLGYDDFNESLCIKEIVHETLAELRVNPTRVAQAIWNDSWVALTSLGFARGHAMGAFDAMVASEFWQSRVFVKTYRERRSALALYRAYYRVFASQLCFYQALQVIAFVGFDWRAMSSVFVTHSAMKAFERFANWFMTREPREPTNTILSKYFASKGRFKTTHGLDERALHSTFGLTAQEVVENRRLALAGKSEPISSPLNNYMGGMARLQRRHYVIEGTPIYGIFGFVEWVLWFCFNITWYIAQYYESSIQQDLRDWWAVYCGCYLGLHFIHWCITVRDGYMESLTHMLRLPKWFTIHSPRPTPTSWIAGKMHMKWKLWRLNNLFWILVFCMKLPFDYFVICSPAVTPLRLVQLRGWLECGDNTYGGSSWYTYPFPCIGGDWLLQAVRVAPFVVIIYMDTSLFYQIATTIYGMLRGLFKLDLGVLTSWGEMVTEFYRAPARWWHKCMSPMGNHNHLAMVKQYMILEEMQSGATGQVSDGRMFKQVVLTPEIINDRKKQADALKLRRKADGGSLTSMRNKQRPVGVGRKPRANVIMASETSKGGDEKGALDTIKNNAVSNVGRATRMVKGMLQGTAPNESSDPVMMMQQKAQEMQRLRRLARGETTPAHKPKYIESDAGDDKSQGKSAAASEAGDAPSESSFHGTVWERGLDMLPGPIRALRRVQSKAISKVKGYPSSNASGPTQSKNLDRTSFSSNGQSSAVTPGQAGPPNSPPTAAKETKKARPSVSSRLRWADGSSDSGGEQSPAAGSSVTPTQPPATTQDTQQQHEQGQGQGQQQQEQPQGEGERVSSSSAGPVGEGSYPASLQSSARRQPRRSVAMPGMGEITPARDAANARAVDRADARAGRPIGEAREWQSRDRHYGVVVADEEDEASSTISDSSSNSSGRCMRRRTLEEAEARFNERTWQPSMTGLRAMFGALWPSPQASAAAPGPAALWWAINSRQNSSSNGVGRQLSVASESVEWLQDEGFSDDDASSLRQEEEEPNWEVLNAFQLGMQRAQSLSNRDPSSQDPPQPPNVPLPPAPAPPPDLRSHPSNDLRSRPSLGETAAQQAAWQASQARWGHPHCSVAGPVGEADEGPEGTGGSLSNEASLLARLQQTLSRSGNVTDGSMSSGSDSSAERNLASAQDASQDTSSILPQLNRMLNQSNMPSLNSNAGDPGSGVQGLPRVTGGMAPGDASIRTSDPGNAEATAGGGLRDQLGNILGSDSSSFTGQNQVNLLQQIGNILDRDSPQEGIKDTDDSLSASSASNNGPEKPSAMPNLEALQKQADVPKDAPVRKGVSFMPSNVYEGPKEGKSEANSEYWDVEAGANANGGKGDLGPAGSFIGGLLSRFNLKGNSVKGNSVVGRADSRSGRARRQLSQAGRGGKSVKFVQSRSASKAENRSALARDLERTAAVASNRANSTVSMGKAKKHRSELDKYNDPDGTGVDELHYQMMQWDAFAQAWDEIIDDLREADLVSNKEVGLLKFVKLELGSRNCGLRPILLPTFFYAGQIRKVVDTGKVTTPQIMVLNELRVLCVWLGCNVGLLSGKHAHVISSAPFYPGHINVKHSLHRKKFYAAGLKMVQALEDICSKEEIPFDMRDIADHMLTILTSLESEAFAIAKAHSMDKASAEDLELSNVLLEVVQEMKHELCRNPDELKIIIKTALSTTSTANYRELHRVVLVIKRMLVTTIAESTPESEEPRRALGFFVNSLAHPGLDKPPSMDKMGSWSILVPLYEEDVVYALRGDQLAKELKLRKRKMVDLLTEGEDGISIMEYLKTMLPKDWNNFKERMKMLIPDIDVNSLTENDFTQGNWLYDFRMELQIWASCRGQLLARTVTGMMRNVKALQLMAKLEHPIPHTMSALEHERWIKKMVTNKFEMVITPQAYAKNRDSKDLRQTWLAKSVDLLLVRFPMCLKAAYLEQAEVEGLGKTEYSVCMRGRDKDNLNDMPYMEEQPVYEIYRVRLPFNRYSTRGVIVGEGKPENQNHAIIFSHCEGVQAVDMNQDGYMCEWLKMRNLLTELDPSNNANYKTWCEDDEHFVFDSSLTAAEVHAIVRHRQNNSISTALVGFREWIFSESAGALGRFAAATEYAFGTISQRTMTFPARVRLHYGHPDLFNKLFVMTKGGISKATRSLHLTEDVFCGCNHMLRGARIRYKEYIACGKGRDMGFDSINGFNFKIAGGGGELAISRESPRMGVHLDYARLMAFYQSLVGFYVNSWLTFMAVYLNLYALLVYSWAQATEIQAEDVQQIYNVQQVLQLGTLALIPYAGQLLLENGLVRTTMELFEQLLTGSLVFYTFQQQTVAQSFLYDLSYGSGKYVGTGRGFNIFSLEFIRIFTLYCRSHLYMSFELVFSLATLFIIRDCEDCDYGALTWSTWLLATTLTFAPMWFNPFSFDSDKVRANFEKWQRWMDGDVDLATGSNWYTWHNSQMEKLRNDSGNNTDTWMNWARAVATTTPYWLMALGASSRIDICLDIDQVRVLSARALSVGQLSVTFWY
uniref:1,3-beta-glucan synthase n=1 Tax=Dunaliella tertiolecta TaxID=3047 RepID=A0A6S8NKA7_DUNTE